MSNPVLARDLEILLTRSMRDITHYLAQQAPIYTDPGDPMVARVADVFRDIRQEDAQITDEILQLSQSRGVHLTPGQFPIRIGQYNYLQLDFVVHRYAELAQEELDDLLPLKDQYAADPVVGPLIAKIVAARRAQLRKVETLVEEYDARKAPGGAGATA